MFLSVLFVENSTALKALGLKLAQLVSATMTVPEHTAI